MENSHPRSPARDAGGPAPKRPPPQRSRRTASRPHARTAPATAAALIAALQLGVPLEACMPSRLWTGLPLLALTLLPTCGPCVAGWPSLPYSLPASLPLPCRCQPLLAAKPPHSLMRSHTLHQKASCSFCMKLCLTSFSPYCALSPSACAILSLSSREGHVLACSWNRRRRWGPGELLCD